MITISVNEAPTADADRIVVLERSVEELTLAFEMLLKRLFSDHHACACGDPKCPNRAAYEVAEEPLPEEPNTVSGASGASGSGGQYL